MDISYYDTMPQARGSLFQAIMFRDNLSVYHGRAIYSLLDLMGDLGGITEIFSIMFGMFLFPISYHSYIVKSLGKLFFAKAK